MKILVFESDAATREIFDQKLTGNDIIHFDTPISAEALTQHPDAEAISCFVGSQLRAPEMDLVPTLKLIITRSAGFDHIDCAHAKEKGIAVVRVPRYGQHTVAEFAFALMLSLSRRVVDAATRMRETGAFDPKPFEGFDLFGKTLGVVGTGNIGRAVVGIARGFGMHILMHDMYPAADLASDTARYVPLEELLAQSDIVTLHAPYTPENHHLMNADRLAQMKHGAFLINTARGELVDTRALVAALGTGQLAGAALDVLEDERVFKTGGMMPDASDVDELKTLVYDHELVRNPNVIVTPHMAFNTREAYRDIITISADNVLAFLAGAPVNTVQV